MKSRSASLPLLVLVALIALVLGSFGTAVAGPALTKGSVKKIAAKVVKKQAPSLTVSSATNANNANNAANATNAANLAGKPAAAYLDASQVFTTAITVGVSNVTINVPLTPGIYYMSYGAYLSGGSGASGCYFRRELPNGDHNGYFADNIGTGQGFSGSAVVPLAAGEKLWLYCYSSSNFTTLGGTAPDPIQVVATPLDGVTTTAVAPTPRPGGAGRS